MTITDEDILKSVISRLKDNGFNVIADDINEGYIKPAIFVSCYPTKIERLCGGIERVTSSVTLEYHPDIESRVQCIKAADKLRKTFFYDALHIGSRVFMLEDISFDVDTEKTIMLTCEFYVTYEQFMPDDEDFEDMNRLNLGGV